MIERSRNSELDVMETKENMEHIALNDLRRHNARFEARMVEAATAVLSSGWYVLGEQVRSFESEFAEYCGVPHCIGMGNGTDALELGLRALGVRAGEKVVTVANAGMYSTSAIRSIGAEPVFVDINPSDLQVDLHSLAPLIRKKPAAVIITHLYGRLADVQQVSAACKDFDVPLLEDCAQAHGARRDGLIAGSVGALGCFSFYPTKNLGALGDGGAVVTRDPILAATLRSLHQYGWASKYQAEREGGRNSRLDEIQAGFLRIKLPLLDGLNALRRGVSRRYVDEISHPLITLPAMASDDDVAHLFVIRCASRDSLRAHLRQAGISSDIHYPVPDHRQTCFGGRYAHVRLPETERACTEILTLPCFPEMTDAEVGRVINACNSWPT